MITLSNNQKQRLMRRKSSDITKLTDAYTRNMNAMTSDYETSFADYNKKRDEIMAPYNKAVDQYKADYGVYEQSLAGYKQRLADYTAKLEDIQKNPLEEIDKSKYTTQGILRYGTMINFDGQSYAAGDGIVSSTLPDGYTFEKGVLYKRKDAGTFTEKAPTAPTAPTEPEVPEFDSTQFETKKAALETDYQRELGERKAGRLGAVSRKGARPMLQGASS